MEEEMEVAKDDGCWLFFPLFYSVHSKALSIKGFINLNYLSFDACKIKHTCFPPAFSFIY